MVQSGSLKSTVNTRLPPCIRHTGAYRFGFNGQEKINEIFGNANFLDFRFRGCDPRLGRFFAVDPLTKSYPELTPYQFASNTPIWANELEGLEPWYSNSGVPQQQLNQSLAPISLVGAHVVAYGPLSIEYASSKGLAPIPSVALDGVVVKPNSVYPEVKNQRDNRYSPNTDLTPLIEATNNTGTGLQAIGFLSLAFCQPEIGIPLIAYGKTLSSISDVADPINKLAENKPEEAAKSIIITLTANVTGKYFSDVIISEGKLIDEIDQTIINTSIDLKMEGIKKGADKIVDIKN